MVQFTTFFRAIDESIKELSDYKLFSRRFTFKLLFVHKISIVDIRQVLKYACAYENQITVMQTPNFTPQIHRLMTMDQLLIEYLRIHVKLHIAGKAYYLVFINFYEYWQKFRLGKNVQRYPHKKINLFLNQVKSRFCNFQ